MFLDKNLISSVKQLFTRKKFVLIRNYVRDGDKVNVRSYFSGKPHHPREIYLISIYYR